MERQTRQLLGILVDDLTDGLITELSKGEALETDLRQRVAASRQTIGRRLTELEAWGVVVSEDRRTPGPGRPTRAWRLAATEVAAFLDDADRMVLNLLEGRARRHREAIRPPAEASNVRQLRR